MKFKRFLLIFVAVLALIGLSQGGKKTAKGTLPPAVSTAISTTAPTTAPTTARQTEATKARKETTAATAAAQSPTTKPTEDNGRDYVANKNTRKFHYPSCSSAGQIKEANRWDFHGTREELVAKGYSPCKRCDP